MRFVRKSEYRDVERVLQRSQPEPPAPLLTALVEEIDAHPRRRGAAPRRVLAVAVSAGMLGAFAALGGVGYASSAAKHAANVTHVAKMVGLAGPTAKSSGSETHNPTFGQYRPGKGCGDKNHVHLRENECKKGPK